mmetsp:Transcript_7951/g.17090  ORF Transcript_7951/g.17090 Transcript_7951/m.17090 type:complete len:298 (-) Transcript_7951:657-1550(-)
MSRTQSPHVPGDAHALVQKSRQGPCRFTALLSASIHAFLRKAALAAQEDRQGPHCLVQIGRSITVAVVFESILANVLPVANQHCRGLCVGRGGHVGPIGSILVPQSLLIGSFFGREGFRLLPSEFFHALGNQRGKGTGVPKTGHGQNLSPAGGITANPTGIGRNLGFHGPVPPVQVRIGGGAFWIQALVQAGELSGIAFQKGCPADIGGRKAVSAKKGAVVLCFTQQGVGFSECFFEFVLPKGGSVVTKQKGRPGGRTGLLWKNVAKRPFRFVDDLVVDILRIQRYCCIVAPVDFPH